MILAELAKNPETTPNALSKLVVKKYLTSYTATELVTQSAFDLSHSTKIATAFDQMANALNSQLADATVLAALISARNQVQSYEVPDYVDAVDWATLLQSQVSNTAIQTACQGVKDAAKVGQFVIASGYKNKSMANSHDAAIYLPTKTLSPLYAKLDFAQNTTWGQFVSNYIAATARR